MINASKTRGRRGGRPQGRDARARRAAEALGSRRRRRRRGGGGRGRRRGRRRGRFRVVPLGRRRRGSRATRRPKGKRVRSWSIDGFLFEIVSGGAAVSPAPSSARAGRWRSTRPSRARGTLQAGTLPRPRRNRRVVVSLGVGSARRPRRRPGARSSSPSRRRAFGRWPRGVVAEDSAADDPRRVVLPSRFVWRRSRSTGSPRRGHAPRRAGARRLGVAGLARSRSRRGGEGEEDAARGLVDRFLAAASSSSGGAHRRGTGADAQTTTLAAAAAFSFPVRGIPAAGQKRRWPRRAPRRRVGGAGARGDGARGRRFRGRGAFGDARATLLAEDSEQSAPRGVFSFVGAGRIRRPLINPRRFSFLVALDAPGRVLAARAAFALFECATDRPAETVAARQAASALLAALAEAAPRRSPPRSRRDCARRTEPFEGGGGSRSESVFKGRRRSGDPKRRPTRETPGAGTTTGTTGMPSGTAGTMPSPTPQPRPRFRLHLPARRLLLPPLPPESLTRRRRRRFWRWRRSRRRPPRASPPSPTTSRRPRRSRRRNRRGPTRRAAAAAGAVALSRARRRASGGGVPQGDEPRRRLGARVRVFFAR